MTLSDRIAAAQTAALTAAAERAILTGEGTAASAGLSLQSIAAAHAKTEQVHRYLDAVEAEARESLYVLVPRFDAEPDALRLDSINYLESVVRAAMTARRLLRTPGLLAAAVVRESAGPPHPEHPWRMPQGRLALHLITKGSEPDALDRISDLLR